jgi:hypothetical protein
MADSIPLVRQSVRHRIGTVSVMPPECCPSSLRNRVRHGPAHADKAALKEQFEDERLSLQLRLEQLERQMRGSKIVKLVRP